MMMKKKRNPLSRFILIRRQIYLMRCEWNENDLLRFRKSKLSEKQILNLVMRASVWFNSFRSLFFFRLRSLSSFFSKNYFMWTTVAAAVIQVLLPHFQIARVCVGKSSCQKCSNTEKMIIFLIVSRIEWGGIGCNENPIWIMNSYACKQILN